jgi:hypothetical protein
MWFEYLSKPAALNRKFTYISLPFTENYINLMEEEPLPSHSQPFKNVSLGPHFIGCYRTVIVPLLFSFGDLMGSVCKAMGETTSTE